MRVLIVQNDETESLGLYEVYLREKRVKYTIFHAYILENEEKFPKVIEYDAFIIGPTPISANSVEQHDFLRKEWCFLGKVIDSGKPCLGVCCGGQMLARWLGAEVRKSPEREVGNYEIRLTEVGKVNPLFSGFPQVFPVFQWHSDMFDVPNGGELLVEGDSCPIQSFGYGNVWGILFHLEIDSSEAERWVDAYPEEAKAVGKTREQIINECKDKELDMKNLAYLLMENFLGK
jgi:GMP synthase-like glutamine amidotransferase